MSSKFSPSELTSGMAMGLDFISKLSKKIIENGGNPLLIHRLTLPSGEIFLEKLAKEIVGMYFPVLRSEIEANALEWSQKESNNPRYHESDCKYFWTALDLEETYGIPELRFQDNNPTLPPVPEELRKQIIGKPLEYPLVVSYENLEYVVTSLIDEHSPNPLPGQISKNIDEIIIAETKYFDLKN